MKRMILAAGLAASIGVAYAAAPTQWYAVDYGNGTCIKSPWSPLDFVRGLRKEGDVPNVEIYHPLKQGRLVSIKYLGSNGERLGLAFASRRSTCLGFLAYEKDRGLIPHYSELK